MSGFHPLPCSLLYPIHLSSGLKSGARYSKKPPSVLDFPSLPYIGLEALFTEGVQSKSDKRLDDFSRYLSKAAKRTVMTTTWASALKPSKTRNPRPVPSNLHLAPGFKLHCRPTMTDAACSNRSWGAPLQGVPNIVLTKDDIAAFASRPLHLAAEKFVTIPVLPVSSPLKLKAPEPLEKASAESIAMALPFDVAKHPAAQSSAAQAMVERMALDMHTSGEKAKRPSPKPVLHCLSKEDLVLIHQVVDGNLSGAEPKAQEAMVLVKSALRDLEDLAKGLRDLSSADAKANSVAVQTIADRANATRSLQSQGSVSAAALEEKTAGEDEKEAERVCHELLRIANQRVTIEPLQVAAAVASTKAPEDMRLLNPFLENADVELLLGLATSMMGRSVRMAQTARVVAAIGDLTGKLRGLLKHLVTSGLQDLMGVTPTMVDAALAATGNDAVEAASHLRNMASSLNRLADTVRSASPKKSEKMQEQQQRRDLAVDYASVVFHLTDFDEAAALKMLDDPAGSWWATPVSPSLTRTLTQAAAGSFPAPLQSGQGPPPVGLRARS